jgi:hypothetical protein
MTGGSGQLLRRDITSDFGKEEEETVGHTATSLPLKGPKPVLRGPIFAPRANWDSGFTDEGGNIDVTPMVRHSGDLNAERCELLL